MKWRYTHMTKQELALEVIERLKKEYPDADCTLDYDNAWKLLVSVRLAAQCTDARVNVVVLLWRRLQMRMLQILRRSCGLVGWVRVRQGISVPV